MLCICLFHVSGKSSFSFYSLSMVRVGDVETSLAGLIIRLFCEAAEVIFIGSSECDCLWIL